jgi:predicted RNase H-like HicB family nuclease
LLEPVRPGKSKGVELPTRTLHCHAEGRDGDWEATCLDLDIAVQGRSFEEVSGSLREAISLYLKTTADLPADQQPALLRRPVPFLVRLKFLAHAARGLFTAGDGDKQRHQFTMPLAA